MSKFDILKEDNEILANAPVTSNKKEKENLRVNLLVTNFSKRLKDKLDKQKKEGGESTASFIKRAAIKLAKEEGLI